MSAGIGELSSRYRVWFCDIWGVLHNGVAVFEKAHESLLKHRENGGVVVLVTNAPRFSSYVKESLYALGVLDNAYDAIVSSGDVTAALLASYRHARVFHIGTPGAHKLFGLDPKMAWVKTPEEADVALCTGLVPLEHGFSEEVWRSFHDDDLAVHVPLLERLKGFSVPMVCANPDLVVEVGGRLVPCAGALAEIYQTLGGEVKMAGKPYLAIYERALSCAEEVLGRSVEKKEILAIGDGLKTDLMGAFNFGVSAVFIGFGVHRSDFLAHTLKHLRPTQDPLPSTTEQDRYEEQGERADTTFRDQFVLEHIPALSLVKTLDHLFW